MGVEAYVDIPPMTMDDIPEYKQMMAEALP
jgi:hypothetical protein